MIVLEQRFARRWWMSSLIALSSCSCAGSGVAQTGVANTPATPPAFETVVVKPSAGNSPLVAWGVNQTGYFASNVALGRVILDAYVIPDNSSMRASLDRLKDAPAWVMTSPYDITAKADEVTIAAMKGMNQAQQLGLEAPMLRAMLEDRFKLSAHSAFVEVPGYALAAGKHGIKMKEAPADEAMPRNAMGFGGPWKMVFRRTSDGKQSGVAYLGITMGELAQFLSKAGVPVIDQTGLTARYDVELQSTDIDAASSDGTPAPRPDIGHAYDWQALGLEMKPIKAPVVSVVIDHVERPTAN
jgi:uncharacterized protein (TIGR03435 family)